MTKIVVVDTGPLIALSLIDLLPVLPKLFTVVCAPEAVVAEATADTAKPVTGKAASSRLPAFTFTDE